MKKINILGILTLASCYAPSGETAGSSHSGQGAHGFLDNHQGEALRADMQEKPVGDRFGCDLMLVPDLDGDQRADIAIADPSDADGSGESCVWIVSTGSWRRLRRIPLGAVEGREISLAQAYDYDKDGRSDIAIGLPYSENGDWSGKVNIYGSKIGYLIRKIENASSQVFRPEDGDQLRFGQALVYLDGPADENQALVVSDYGSWEEDVSWEGVVSWCTHTGERVRSVRGGSRGAGYGSSIFALEDLDGDGWAEVLASSALGVFHILSGSDGSMIESVEIANAPSRALIEAVIVPDVDGDGVSDFVVGAYTDQLDGPHPGSVNCYSGRSREELWSRVQDTPDATGFGAALASIGDLNDDGFDDLAIGVPYVGEVQFLSGKTGAELLRTPRREQWFGHNLLRVDDLDGDGRPELIISSGAKRSDSHPGALFLLWSRTQEVEEILTRHKLSRS